MTEELAGTITDAGDAVAPARGSEIGRFIVLATLGAGGMGVVFSAYDPDLDRKVAIKLLRSDSRAQLVAEAQAMARLRHPGIVAVHEIGDGFVVMEHVEGGTLRAWMEAAERPWREVLAMFLGAGEGLAAAHREGIVHRDFKPENVLVDRDGRARVTDFGLAGIAPGVVAGTRPYMAPEQLRGEPCDARADQYAFCVALAEALDGATGTIPGWLRAALTRGRAEDPAARWPTLEALLAELRHDRWARRRAVAAIAVGLALAAAFVIGRQHTAAVSCDAGAAEAAVVWNESARARVRAAFAATGRPYAGDTFQRVDAALAARLGAWARAHRDACEATHVRHEQSEALLDLRMSCLGRARAETAALVTLLGKVDAGALEHAVQAAAQTGDVEACADLAALSAAAPPPRDPETARRVEALRQELPRLVALRQLGNWKEGLAAAHELVARARGLGYTPLLVAAVLQQARFELDAGGDDAGIEGMYEAARLGSEARDDDVVAQATVDLVFALFVRKQRFEAADVAYRLAEAATARAGNTPARLARLFRWRARLANWKGDHVSPLLLSLLVVALEESVHGPDSFAVAEALGSLAGMMYRLGQYQAGEPVYERAIATAAKALGAQHPYVAEMLSNHGSGMMNASKLDAAAPALERALAIYERALGPDDIRVAEVAYNLAATRWEQHRFSEAHALIDRSIRIDTLRLGAEHPMLASRYDVLGAIAHGEGMLEEAHRAAERALAIRRQAQGLDRAEAGLSYELDAGHLLALGRQAEARAAVDEALAVYRKTVGDQHPYTGSGLRVLGDVLVADGRARDAVPLYERSIALLEKSLGPSSLTLSRPLHGLADARLATGDAHGALAAAERAVALAAKAPPGELEAAQFRLAKARFALGDAGAVALARTARARLAALPFPADDLPAIDRWLASR